MALKIAEPAAINVTAPSFHRWAQDYLACAEGFTMPPGRKFSPVPFALLCRSLELELKSRLLRSAHLGGPSRKAIKDRFGHDLLKAYRALEPHDQILSKKEEKVLATASEIYDKEKGFDYPQVWDMLGAYKNYPSLADLTVVAKKLVEDGNARRVKP
jgi:hypothetical protein